MIKVETDKKLHFLAGMLIAAISLALGISMAITLGLVTTIAVLKEASDAYANYKAVKKYLPKPHVVELLDAVYTIAGGSFIVAISYFLTK